MSTLDTPVPIIEADQEVPRIATVRLRTSRISQLVTLVAVVVPPLGIFSVMGLFWGVGFNWVDLPQGKFRTDLISSRFNWTLSPRAAVTTLIQYNSSAESLTSSVRLRWEYEPGSDFFVVYSDGRETDVRGFPLLQHRTFAVKITKLFRF